MTAAAATESREWFLRQAQRGMLQGQLHVHSFVSIDRVMCWGKGTFKELGLFVHGFVKLQDGCNVATPDRHKLSGPETSCQVQYPIQHLHFHSSLLPHANKLNTLTCSSSWELTKQ
jgi:hypothetical protein